MNSRSDRIGVQIDGNAETGVYTVNADGSGNGSSLNFPPHLYWKSTAASQTVKTWYPATDVPVSLSEQSGGLAYVLAGTESGDYKNEVSLTFTHKGTNNITGDYSRNEQDNAILITSDTLTVTKCHFGKDEVKRI